MDKRILDKIFILGSDYQSVLLKYITIDNLPKFLGGSCTCAHMDGGCCPNPSNTSLKGNILAYGHEWTLSKTYSLHQHEISVLDKGELEYRFQLSTPITFKIYKDDLVYVFIIVYFLNCILEFMNLLIPPIQEEFLLKKEITFLNGMHKD